MNNTFQNFHDTFDGFGASPDGLGAPAPRPFGEDALTPQSTTPNPALRALKITWALAGVAGGVVGAYHGYKRNESIGWALVWSLLGSIAPVVVIPIAYAQGIGERKRGR